MSGHALQGKGRRGGHAHRHTQGHTRPSTGGEGLSKTPADARENAGPCSQAGSGGRLLPPFPQAGLLRLCSKDSLCLPRGLVHRLPP